MTKTNIYEIDREIERILADSVDPETGEVTIDTDALDALQMARDEKVENLALYEKNMNALIKSMKEEEANLAKRRKAMENKRERLNNYLTSVLNGAKFTTARVAVTFRRSSSTDIAPGFVEWAKTQRPDLLRYKEPEADKTAVGKALADGADIPFASIKESVSLSIK